MKNNINFILNFILRFDNLQFELKSSFNPIMKKIKKFAFRYNNLTPNTIFNIYPYKKETK